MKTVYRPRAWPIGRWTVPMITPFQTVVDFRADKAGFVVAQWVKKATWGRDQAVAEGWREGT